jgi:hypothetical protein
MDDKMLFDIISDVDEVFHNVVNNLKNENEILKKENNNLKTILDESTLLAKEILIILNNQLGGTNPHLTDFLKHFLK